MSDLALPVCAGVYVGAHINSKSKGWLLRHGITHVVNATPSAPCHHPDLCTYLRVPVQDVDNEGIEAWFEHVCDFIVAAHARGGSVLIHCMMGRSRSVTLAAAFLMRQTGASYTQAIQAIRSVRPSARLNAGFLRKLLAYEAKLAVAAALNGAAVDVKFCGVQEQEGTAKAYVSVSVLVYAMATAQSARPRSDTVFVRVVLSVALMGAGVRTAREGAGKSQQ
eukprot:6214470-Pleurochrysis_carterae.AAC.1